MILDAFDSVKNRRRDQHRFKGLLRQLISEDECVVKADILTLINVIVNFPIEISLRIELRNEFRALGLLDLFPGLDLMDYPALNQQLTLFRDEMSEDSDEMAKKIGPEKIGNVSSGVSNLLRALEDKYAKNPQQLFKLLENLNEMKPKQTNNTDGKEVQILEKLLAEKDAELRRLKQRTVLYFWVSSLFSPLFNKVNISGDENARFAILADSPDSVASEGL